jgi:hypothetical protein
MGRRPVKKGCAKWLRVFTVDGVRFVCGTARNRTGCAVEHRALDGASRSLQGEFEQVIMSKF